MSYDDWANQYFGLMGMQANQAYRVGNDNASLAIGGDGGLDLDAARRWAVCGPVFAMDGGELDWGPADPFDLSNRLSDLMATTLGIDTSHTKQEATRVFLETHLDDGYGWLTWLDVQPHSTVFRSTVQLATRVANVADPKPSAPFYFYVGTFQVVVSVNLSKSELLGGDWYSQPGTTHATWLNLTACGEN